MDPTTLADQLAARPEKHYAEQLLKPFKRQLGLSEAYFTRVAALFGTDAGAARRVAALWPTVLRYGDDPSYAYRAKGAADRLNGHWLASANAFLKAGKLAADQCSRLSFQVGAVDSLARAGQTDRAVRLGRRLAAGLERLGEPYLAARVRLNVGNALLWQDSYVLAAKWLRQALPALLEGGLETEAVFAEMGLSTSLLFGGDPEHARQHALAAKAAAERLGLAHTAALCDINAAHASLVQGRGDEALQALLRSRDAFADSPHDLLRISEFLGDAYLRVNLWPEAIDAYREAIELRAAGTVLDYANSLLGLGQAYVLAEEASLAKRPLARASSLFRKHGNLAWAAASDAWLARAEQLLGNARKAGRLAQRAAEEAGRARSPFIEAESLLIAAELEPHLAGLRRAQTIVTRRGYRSLAWRVPALRAAADPDRRLRHYRRMFDAIVENRILTESSSSRSAYMRDKADLISAFLAELLRHPTKRRVGEAIAAVERSRSAALLDEILSSHPAALGANDVQRLEELRRELHSIEPQGPATGARRSGPTQERLAALQRRWVEATHRLVPQANPADATARVPILTRAGERYHALTGGRSTLLGVTPASLAAQLKWVQFELLAPMSYRDADASEVCDLLCELGRQVILPWAREAEVISVAPDGALWQVPWAACLGAMGWQSEPLLALHPAMSQIAGTRISPRSKCMLWVDQAPDLYHAAGEETSFLQKFPDAIVCRTAAEAREALSSEVDLLHVISHARHNPTNPMFSALQFADGSLFATEIARSSLRADVVTLSACDTGNVSVSLRDDPDGLARAFLARGAHSVIGSAWPLDDEAAGRLYLTLYDALILGASVVEALAEARRATRAWRAHPYFWGSPLLFGGYAR